MLLQNYWKFPNRNVQTFGYVYHDTNGLNHGPVWKTQSIILSEIFTVILWQDCCGKGNSRKFYWSTVGKQFLLGTAYMCFDRTDYSCLCMLMTKNPLPSNDCGLEIKVRCACPDSSAVRSDCTLTQKRPEVDTGWSMCNAYEPPTKSSQVGIRSELRIVSGIS